jgi:uncharacterized protein YgiM (DUF1202 family)
MSNNDEWEYHHTTDSGYRVNEDGYDKNGIGHKYDVRPSSSNNSTSGGSSSDADFESRFMLVTAKLALLGFFIFILYKINQFFIANWITVVTILGAFIICAIACFFIIHKGTRKLILKIFFAILASFGIMYAGLTFGPRISEKYFNLQYNLKYNPKALAAIQEKETMLYGYVTADVLNIRAEPFALAEVIGQFSKDDRIEITDNSDSWWLEVKYENSGGYVESTYVRLE